MSGHYGGNPLAWDGGANAPHISRYFIARGWIMPHETVLDAACCTGYGAKMIANTSKKVIGYDIDEGCIDNANHDKPDNCEFAVKDLNTCTLPEVDVSVSLETIEHLENMNHFIKELKSKVQRLIIACVPIGGTAWAYKGEKGPHTEVNDFMNNDALDKLFMDDDWKKQSGFSYGYSYFGIYFKKPLEHL